MKFRSINLTVVAVALIALCMQGAFAEPQYLGVSGAETLGSGRLTTIAVDTKDQPHIVADGGSWAYIYDKINGSWANSSVNLGNLGYSQFFNPNIEIDENDVAWCSGVVFGRNVGMAMIVRGSVSTNPQAPLPGFSYQNVTPGSWGVGEVSLDPQQLGKAYLAGSSGYYGIFNYNPAAGGRVQREGDIQRLYAGNGGEKNAFWVSKNEIGGTIKHMATNGYSKQDSRYRNSTMDNPVDWAAYTRFPSMGNDGAYLDLKSDSKNPQIAYLASAFYGTGVYMNIWNGAAMRRSDTNLILIDAIGEQGLRRFSPQMYPANNGGVYVTYTRNEMVMLQYVTSEGATPWGAPKEICSGGRSSICVDSVGDIHLAYTEGDQTKYRLVEIAGDGGLDELFGGVENNDGSYSSEWFGRFEILDGNWIEHETLGRILVDKSSNENIIWAYKDGVGWFWTRPTMFPYLFSMAEGGFLWYARNTSDPAWFYNFEHEMWKTDQQYMAVIDVDTDGLSPTCFEDEDATQETFVVSNTGEGLLSYRVSESIPWLSLDPKGGDLAADAGQTITLTYDTNGLDVGTYEETIVAWAPGAQNTPINIPVTLTVVKKLPGQVIEGIDLQNPVEISVNAGENAAPIQFDVKNSGLYTLFYSIEISDGDDWLSVDLLKDIGGGVMVSATGSVTEETDTRTITFDTAGLPAGSYEATVTIASVDSDGRESEGSPSEITLQLTVNATDPT